ncbi:hypothetical protein G7Y29_07680 [Corynebacterium qintianiae]|uniref:DUF559 domain-containing protein n=1 Tax=Corynebacterium qintianiae TaxID=2709392 RepID=A0A7T0KM40_9CORY|nr:hypothetical protein [Corynebacterium qintianiae]QPK82750.1 hypothetical protein G7Y29_07680 [Corynebacterium qintianiae]
MDKQGEWDVITAVARRFPRATLTGPAAARVWGLATLAWVTNVDVLPPGKTRAKTRGGQSWTFRHGKTPERQTAMVQGMRVTKVIVMLFDTYRYHGRLPGLVTLESARNKWPEMTVDRLLELAEELPRAKGLRGFRKLVRESVGTSESALETVVRDIVRQIEGVVVRAQVAFQYRGQYGDPRTGRIDLVVNDVVAIECDGREFHGPGVTEEERYREKQLLNRGMVVLRVGWKEVNDGTLAQLVENALEKITNAPRRAKRPSA